MIKKLLFFVRLLFSKNSKEKQLASVGVINKKLSLSFCFLFVVFFSSVSTILAQAGTVTSNNIGNWNVAATWNPEDINRTGTVSSSTTSTTVTGTGTLFLTELTVGSVITRQNGTAIGTVTSIASNTNLTLTANATNNVTNQNYRTVSGPPSPVDNVIIGNNHSVTVNGNYTCAQVNIGTSNNNTASLIFSNGAQLTVNGTFTLGGTNSGNNRPGLLNMTSGGTLLVNSFALGNAVGSVFTPGSGSVQLTATNTLPSSVFTTFNNLSIITGTTTMSTGLTINGNLNIANATTLNTGNQSLTLRGNFSNNGTFTAGSSPINISGTTNQSISGFTTTGLVTMNKTGGTATLAGNVTSTGTALTINGSGGTLNLGSVYTHSFTSVALTAGTLNGGSSILALSGATPFSGSSTFVPSMSTVNLNGGTQSTVLSNFYNLTLSGNNTKTFSVATTIANILTIANTSAKASLGTFGHTAIGLLTAGATKTSGIYGGTGATGGATVDTNYFSNGTGRVTISNNSCDLFAVVAPITNVLLNTLDNTTSASSTSSYESIAAAGTATTTLTKGEYYSLVVKANTNGDVNGYYTAFFDWNGNNNYADAGEGPFTIGTLRNSSGSDGKATSIYFQVPAGATGTNIKMRVIGLLGAYNNTVCTTNTGSGQVEEYTITLQAPCSTSLPTTVTTNSTSTSVCPNVPFILSLGSTFGDGTTYVWQTSPDGNAPWTTAASAATTFFTSDFSTVQGINTTVGDIALAGGDTEIKNGELILTDIALGGHNGGFLINKSNASNISAFTAAFKYRINDGGTVGADGLSLSYGPGFAANAGGGESGEGSGIVIQFDTYDNEGVATGSRVRVLYNNAILFNSAINAPFNIRTATYRDVKLSVDSKGYLTLTIQNSGGTNIIVVSKLLLPNYVSTDKSTWKFKFSARTGGSNDKHSLDDVTINFLDTGFSNSTLATSQTVKTYYRAQITCGTSVYSSPVFVDMTSAVITTQPTAPTAVCSGTGVRTISVAATGSGLAYSWRKDGIALTNNSVISGQGTNTLTLTNPLTANAGNYDVVVTGACPSSVTSSAVTVTVNSLPTPTFVSPATSPVCAGTDVTYTTQSGMTNYVWGFPGVLNTNYAIVSGGTNIDNIAVIRYITSGSKTVTINYTNANGCTATVATSSSALTVNALPVITTPPQALVLCEGNNGSFVVATSATSPTYQWQYSSASTGPWTNTNLAAGVSGHTSATLSLTAVPYSYNDNYVQCIITSNGCNTISSPVKLTVNQLPATPTQGTKTPYTCTQTGSVVLNNLPAGAWTLTQTGTVNNVITGSGTTYTVTGLVGGNYSFTVSNGTCPSLSSSTVTINDLSTTTWDGSVWSDGIGPDATKTAIFAGAYTMTGDLEACSCTINSGVNLVVPTGRTLKVTNALHVTTGGSLTFENSSSLVQVNDASVNTGNITYKRISKQIRLADFTYWSTPVNPQTLLNVSPGTQYNMYMGFTGDNWLVTDRSNTMMVGKGYIIRGPQHFSNTVKADYEASFYGVPNNGSLSGETLQAGKFYLIGNPYPSALKASAFLAGNLFMNGTLYFWTHNTPVVLGGAYQYTTSDYASYNLTGGVGTSASSGTPGNNNNTPSGYIAAGQSFFASAATNGTIAFNNGMREGGATNGQFFKPAKTGKETTTDGHHIWLNFTNEGGAFKQVLVGYVDGATNSFDKNYDGETFDGNMYVDFYSVNDQSKFVIQGRALPFADTDIVPLGYRSTIAGDFTIAIDQTDGDLATHAVYIEDKSTGIIHDLKAGKFTFTTAAGTFTDRLVLRYTNKTLGTGDFENTENGILVSVKNKVIKVDSSKENIKEVTIYDVSGKLLYNKKKVGATELQIVNLQAANQVLLVKVTLENNYTTNKKIIFQ